VKKERRLFKIEAASSSGNDYLAKHGKERVWMCNNKTYTHSFFFVTCMQTRGNRRNCFFFLPSAFISSLRIFSSLLLELIGTLSSTSCTTIHPPHKSSLESTLSLQGIYPSEQQKAMDNE
jgi:hypothetical protein